MLKAIALNCTLKMGQAPSSTQLLLEQVLQALHPYGVDGEMVRIADHDIKPGVTSDEGAGDAWPQLRQRILAADILIVGTPIWMGQPSSVVKRVLERMDAFFSEMDEHGNLPSYGKVAAVAVVGNEDGAHHVCAELFQALNDVGFTLPASAVTYWTGEAMQKVNYNDLKQTPEKTASATAMLARNTVHLAKLLKANAYSRQSKH